MKLKRVEYWLRVVKSLGVTGYPPVIIVGTHIDMVDPVQLEEIRHTLTTTFPRGTFGNIKGVHLVSSLKHTGIAELSATIRDIAKNFELVKTLVPASWFQLKELAIKLKRKRDTISFDEWRLMAAEECNLKTLGGKKPVSVYY